MSVRLFRLNRLSLVTWRLVSQQGQRPLLSVTVSYSQFLLRLRLALVQYYFTSKQYSITFFTCTCFQITIRTCSRRRRHECRGCPNHLSLTAHRFLRWWTQRIALSTVRWARGWISLTVRARTMNTQWRLPLALPSVDHSQQWDVPGKVRGLIHTKLVM